MLYFINPPLAAIPDILPFFLSRMVWGIVHDDNARRFDAGQQLFLEPLLELICRRVGMIVGCLAVIAGVKQRSAGESAAGPSVQNHQPPPLAERCLTA